MICAHKTIANVVHDPKMIWSSIFKVLCHLHGEFHAGVRTAGYAPRLSSIVEALAEELLKLHHILLDAQIILPP